jgi:hypothetical protein
MEKIVCLLDSARGRYIPRDFVTDAYGNLDLAHCAAWGLTKRDVEDLLDADGDWCWESWQNVLSKASRRDEQGRLFQLHHDGDLFSYCADEMTEQELIEFLGH